MATVYGAATTDRSTVTRTAAINNLSTWTVLLWFRLTTITNGRRFFNKSAQLNCELQTGGVLFVERGRATANAQAATNSGAVVTGVDYCLGATFNTVAATGRVMNMYLARWGQPLTEIAYSNHTDGSGGLNDDSTTDWRWGNRPANNTAIQARYSYGALIGRELTLDEMRRWQADPKWLAPGVLFCHAFGDDGTVAARDLSGNLFTAVHTGVTLAPSVELPAPWPRRRKWLDVPAAAGAAVVGIRGFPRGMFHGMSRRSDFGRIAG